MGNIGFCACYSIISQVVLYGCQTCGVFLVFFLMYCLSVFCERERTAGEVCRGLGTFNRPSVANSTQLNSIRQPIQRHSLFYSPIPAIVVCLHIHTYSRICMCMCAWEDYGVCVLGGWKWTCACWLCFPTACNPFSVSGGAPIIQHR